MAVWMNNETISRSLYHANVTLSFTSCVYPLIRDYIYLKTLPETWRIPPLEKGLQPTAQKMLDAARIAAQADGAFSTKEEALRRLQEYMATQGE